MGCHTLFQPRLSQPQISRVCKNPQLHILERFLNLRKAHLLMTSPFLHRYKKSLDSMDAENSKEMTLLAIAGAPLVSAMVQESMAGQAGIGWISNANSCKHMNIFVILEKPRSGSNASSTSRFL